ncbi:MAG TPA: tetratricopeptide repeat protein [Candidatus Nitrosotenuis sp.]|nr:tetratricopeptide repeat protein [Candidatus Nitrosotenuis sp.]
MKFLLFELGRRLSSDGVERLARAVREQAALIPGIQVRCVQAAAGQGAALLVGAPGAEAGWVQERVRALLRSRGLSFEEHSLGEGDSPGPGSLQVLGHLESGKALCRLGFLEEAREEFEQALALDPQLAEGFYGLGLVSVEMGDDDQAETYLRRSLELAPRHAASHYVLGGVCQRRGRVEEALAHHTEAVRADPAQACYYDGMGWALLELDDEERALRAFEEALRREPDLPSALSGVATILFSQGKLEEAVRLLQQCLQIHEDYEVARLQLAWCLYHLDRLDEAEDHFVQVIAGGDPDLLPGAYFGLGKLYLLREEPGACMEALEEACSRGWAPACALLAEVCLREGRVSDSRRYYQRALRLDPQLLPEVQPRLALACARLERYPEAERHIRAALRRSGPDARLLELLASIHAARGEWAKARRALNQAEVLDPNSATIAFQHGWILENMNCREESAERYRQALRLDPGCREAYTALGWYYLDQKRVGEAAVLFERGLEEDAEDPELLYGAARVALLEGKPLHAVHLLRRALARSPQTAVYRAYLGLGLCHLGRWPEARPHLEEALKGDLDADTESLVRRFLAGPRKGRTGTRLGRTDFRSRRKGSNPAPCAEKLG